ncbi:MAG TPA: S-layer homology domain-containing protein [Bacillota bacterium]|nr:S-layer homology domain-containing protein [Bacillota bacterium]HQL36723.1 S-layer homology domain-containing protein [Bacillota bacterium]
MLKKKLAALGIAVVFTLSSLTTTVFADNKKPAAGGNITIKVVAPGKGNAYGQTKIKKNEVKKYKFDDCADITWALNAIEKLAGKGIIGGIGNGKYAPKSNVTHVEALAMVMRLTGDAKEAEGMGKKVHPFYQGILPNWGYGYIFMAIEKGILLPEELKDFNPNKPAKRHEIAKYIIRAMGETKKALKHMDEDLDFKDSSAVPDKSVGYVYLVSELKIMIGNEKNMFKPMDPVTRAEMAVLLDRAEGKFDLPDTDNRKNSTVFVSADVDDNEITVKVKGVTVTYDVLEDVQVYRDGSFETIEDLVKGDILQLTLNDSKDVIFIEVVKSAEDDDDEEDEIPVSFRAVSDSSLPKVLKDEIDDMKSKESYAAYEYDNYIYLVAAMGRQRTGGYDIEIEKVYKIGDNDEYTIKAVVDTDEPSSGSNVTQAVTYPYSVVKFKSFDNIEEVIFVDEDDDELDNVEIEDLDEITIIEGKIYGLASSSKTIRIEKSNGSKVSYTVPSGAEIIVNGDDDAKFSDLEVGMSIEIEIADDKVTKVTAEDADENKVSFSEVDYDDLSDRLKDQVNYLKLNKNYKAYEYDNYVYLIATMGKKNSDGYKINIDDVYKIKNGNKYTIKAVVDIDTPSSTSSSDSVYPYSIVRFKNFDGIDTIRFVDENNNKLSEAKIVELDEVVTVEGIISAINSSSKQIKVKKSNGTTVALTIPSSAEITVNDDDDASFSDFEVGMKAEVEIVGDIVTEVVAEDDETEVTGTLTGISISTVKKITLKVDGTTKAYTVDSDVKVIIDNETKRVEDLNVNDKLTLKFTNGILVEIEKE